MPDDRDRRDRTSTRSIRLPLRDDKARLDAATAELDAELENSRLTTERVEQVAADVDSDRLSTDGLVLEPFEEEDTVVRHVRAALHDLGG